MEPKMEPKISERDGAAYVEEEDFLINNYEIHMIIATERCYSSDGDAAGVPFAED